jgi:uncharacterized protein YpmB
MFGSSDAQKHTTHKLLLIIIGVLLLLMGSWAVTYFVVLDGYVRDQARTIGQLQARVQALEEQQKVDGQDINDIYDQINGTGDGTSEPDVIPPGSHT